MSVIFQEDCVGLVLRLALTGSDGTPLDLSNSSSVYFIVLSPDAVRIEKEGYIYGGLTSGVVAYTTQTGDFFTIGTYKYQAKVIMNDGATFFSEVRKIKVKTNLT
jgi:hypothetical protein